MSSPFARSPLTATVGGASAAGAAAASHAAAPRDSLAVRLAAFGALAAYGAAHWTTLVADAPVGRTLLGVAIAIVAGAAIALVGRLPLPAVPRWGLAALIGLVALGLGLMAAGLPGRLLLPEGWSELADGLDRGVAGVQGVEWPYAGPDEWIRLTILLGAPVLLAVAATLAFWPARRAAPFLRMAALVALLLLYGAAVTENDPGAPLARGFVLLVLVGAWLWLPRMPPREAALGGAVVAVVGVLSMPLAAAFDGDRAWWDYRAWSWLGDGKAVTFDWNHQYGPLDWPRDGTTLLNVKSDRPHYWKAEALDTFDGFRWIRSSGVNSDIGAELAFKGFRTDGTSWQNGEYNAAWDEEIRFTVRSLSSELVVGAGVTYDVDPLRADPAADGTTRLLDGEELRKGDSYEIRAYAPDPSARQMRAAPEGYADGLIPYTEIFLPRPGESAIDGVGRQGDAARSAADEARRNVFVPLRGNDELGANPAAATALQESGYAPMYELTQRIIAGKNTAYDAVKAIERHLQGNYRYSERVPTRALPLMGFLFQEKRGYCQQFSGAMALMLRMAGIPARVAAGFSPGSYNKDSGEYRVRDLDAHSWVEVWFTGIGWVPFDPTPAAAPAESQAGAAATSAAPNAGEVRNGREGVAPERTASAPAAGTAEDGGDWVIPALVLALLGLLAAAGFWVMRRVRRLHGLSRSERVEAQLGELRRTLLRLGWDVPGTTTLLTLERRLGRFAGPASEAYAGALRANRYDPREPPGPALRERRAVRRELSRGSVRDRLRGLLAMPPGAPRP